MRWDSHWFYFLCALLLPPYIPSSTRGSQERGISTSLAFFCLHFFSVPWLWLPQHRYVAQGQSTYYSNAPPILPDKLAIKRITLHKFMLLCHVYKVKDDKKGAIPFSDIHQIVESYTCLKNPRVYLPLITYNILWSWFQVLPCPIYLDIAPPLRKVQKIKWPITQLLGDGKIRPSTSLCGYSTLVIPKKEQER